MEKKLICGFSLVGFTVAILVLELVIATDPSSEWLGKLVVGIISGVLATPMFLTLLFWWRDVWS